MRTDEDDFFRFMFWYCGDSRKTVTDALRQWHIYHEDDIEEREKYDDFHTNIKEEDVN